MPILIGMQKLPKGFKDSRIASFKDSLQKANEKLKTLEVLKTKGNKPDVTPTASLSLLHQDSRSTNFLSEPRFHSEETTKQLLFRIK